MPQTRDKRKRIFVTAPYEVGEDGEVVAVLPERCGPAGPAEKCSLFVDHYRARKTGPCFPLAVVGCSMHPGPRYTLYPPGHVPYGRQAAVPCSPSGPVLRSGSTGGPVWEATLFAAAVDAAGGVRWPSDSPCDDERRRRTQGHRLTWAGRLLGVHPDLAPRVQEQIATRLGVSTMTLRTAAGEWASSWMARGSAVVSVLQALSPDGGLLDRILAAGEVVEVWAFPQRWDPARKTWVPVSRQVGRSRSGRRERPVAGAREGRAPPPTKSRGAGGASVC